MGFFKKTVYPKLIMATTAEASSGDLLDEELSGAQEILVEYLTGLAMTIIYFATNFTIFGVMSLMAARRLWQERQKKEDDRTENKIKKAAADANQAAKKT